MRETWQVCQSRVLTLRPMFEPATMSSTASVRMQKNTYTRVSCFSIEVEDSINFPVLIGVSQVFN